MRQAVDAGETDRLVSVAYVTKGKIEHFLAWSATMATP